MKKIFIIAIMLITSLCANCFTEENQTKIENVVNEQNNEVVIEEIENNENLEKNNVEVLEKQIEKENIEMVSPETKKTNENPIENKTLQTTKSTNKATNKPKTTNSQKVQNNNLETQNTNKENTTNIAQEPNTKLDDTNNKSNTKTLTEDDLEYWCVGGGIHHIAGDGKDEHGHYSSWDEADRAFQEYTKGWESVQYKIDHCACGKYYFWAIK